MGDSRLIEVVTQSSQVTENAGVEKTRGASQLWNHKRWFGHANRPNSLWNLQRWFGHANRPNSLDQLHAQVTENAGVEKCTSVRPNSLDQLPAQVTENAGVEKCTSVRPNSLDQLPAQKSNAAYMSTVSHGPFYPLPRTVSLGPFYPLPHQDQRYKHETIKTSLNDDRFKNLVKHMKQTGGFTNRIRQWYASYKWYVSSTCPAPDNCPQKNQDLCEMMAADGFFLLQYLRLGCTASGSAQVQEISTSPNSNAGGFVPLFSQPFAIQEDVMRLGNQIPLFVLQNILQWEATTDRNLNSILKDAWLNLSPIRYKCDNKDSHVQLGSSHLLEFVYENIIRSSSFTRHNKRNQKSRSKRSKKMRNDSLCPLLTAVKLKEKGVKFAPNKGLLSEIRFERKTSTLYLPAIEMDGRTDSVLRNLVGFEASKKEKKPAPMMRYVDLMDRLINRANDVEVLKHYKIIDSHMGNDEDVADVWNRMRDLLHKNSEYAPIDNAVDDVITFCTNKYKTLYTEFKRRYCSKPWIVLSVISACILLVLTVLQTLLAWEQVHLQLESMNKTKLLS